ncbi:hypothetical protein FGG08_000576 [Glutinoglossum americanum]|uniref:DUF7924 domain-containing protein n=1 Tax=Glutinoglossum americanum TaxID=1670608 RepID=A0A9P8L6R4_9PEZI|nr:hypothetical protein FGG08_000576 [Glutinoglossum americanum]
MTNGHARQQLTDHGIHVDSGAIDTKPIGTIVDYVVEYIIQRDCDLPELNGEAQERIVHYAESHTMLNEYTMVSVMGSVLFPELDCTTCLHQIRNGLFRSDCLSFQPTHREAPTTNEAMAIQERIRKAGPLPVPKPDFVFGYSHLAFNQTQISVNSMIDSIAHIAPFMSHPFFVAEWKSSVTDSVFKAENQAARAGTAMVWARRRLRHLATGSYGQATESLCFSLTADSNMGIIWVHWFDSGSYHMKKVEEFFLSRFDSAGELMDLVAKIMDWGLGTRLEEVKEDLDAYIEKRRGELSKQEKKKQRKEKGKGKAKRKLPKQEEEQEDGTGRDEEPSERGGKAMKKKKKRKSSEREAEAKHRGTKKRKRRSEQEEE